MKKTFWLIFWFIPIIAFSQEKAIISFYNKPVAKALFKIEKIYNVRFSYEDNLLKKKEITLIKKERTLNDVIVEFEHKLDITFEQINDRYYIIKKEKIFSKITELNPITIHNYLTKGISKNKNAFFTINPSELDILPGLIEADVLESIQQLPGVVSPNETATGLVVRGGTSDQNRVLWDGINIYHSGHLFSMVSAFNPNISNEIKFYNKGTNPRFGERVASIIDIKTNSDITKNTKAIFSVNGINTDFVIETPIIKNKLSIQLSARRSYTELLQTPTFTGIANKVFQTTKITNLETKTTNFFFIDYNAKVNYQLNKNNFLSFSGIYINNELDYFTRKIDQISNDILKIKNEGLAFNWSKNWSKNIKQETTLSLSKYFLNYNLIEKDDISRSDFDKRNAIFDTDFITELSFKLKKRNYLNLGYQYNFKDVSYAFLNKEEVDLILDFNQETISTHAVFSNYSYKNYDLFDFDIGFRLNYFKELEKIKFEPRFVAYKNLSNHLKLQVTGEVKNQIISQIDETVLSDLSLENKLWHLADDKTFPITNSNQYSIGLLYKNKMWSADLDYYHKYINGLTALSLGFLNPNGQTFHIGNQKVKGIDFYIKKDWNKFNTWFSYSYTDVKSKFSKINSEKYFSSNTNITHALSTSISYRIKQFQIALGWKWRTGKPFTKSIIEDDLMRFKEINTGRLPNYHRLDFSSTYQFAFNKKNKLKGKIGISIRNVYNQKNHLSREYTGYNNVEDPITVQNKYSLGFTPNFLFKVYW